MTKADTEIGSEKESPTSRVAMLILHGVSDQDILSICRERFRLSRDAAHRTLDEARAQILEAARQTRDVARATAIGRLNDIYSRSSRNKDAKTAMAAQRELNRLQRLYDEMPDAPDADILASVQGELELVRGHLLPLKLAPADYPLSEHARMAAQIVRGSNAVDEHALRERP